MIKHLVLDIGTSGVKACVFDQDHTLLAKAYRPLVKKVSGDRVEQSPQGLLRASLAVMREVVRKTKVSSFDGFGFTNQRETTILWDSITGRPVYPAIVWEDTRTAKLCSRLKVRNENWIREKTGLSLLPYFSASKIKWILDHIPKAKKLLKENRLLFGTVDTWILWNIVEGRPHVTDHTNASRTLLYNGRSLQWDEDLLELFSIPKALLPKVVPSQYLFGALRKDIVGTRVPVVAVCGDQQASMVAAGVKKGVTKITYGTGIFISQSLGRKFELHKSFFTTLIPSGKKPYYALEAKIDSCGKRVEPLLERTVKLRAFLKKLAIHTQRFIEKLPMKPKKLIIDGGVTRDGLMGQLQQEVSHIPVCGQKIYDGTSLGISILIGQYLKK